MPISQINTNSIANGAVVAADLAAGAALSNLGTSQLADANMAPGSVIQVVEASVGAATYTNYSSYADFVTGSITTTIANSRILVTMNIPYYVSGSGTWSTSFYVRLRENGTVVSGYEHPGVQSASEFAQVVSTSFLSTSKAVGTYTYVGQSKGTSGSGSYTLARTTDGDANRVRLLMMEIAP